MKCSSIVLLFILAAISVFFATGCNRKSAGDNSTAANTDNSKPKINKPAPDFTVSATDLLNEATADRRKAEEKYAGKQIAVNGRVQNVIIGKAMFVSLEAAEEFVTCQFDEAEKESFIALKGGQNVTVQCSGGEHFALSMPALEHCVVVKVE